MVSLRNAVWALLGQTRPEFDPAKDFIETTAGGLDKRLVSAVWVVSNSHLPFLARGCQSNNLAQTTIHTQYVSQLEVSATEPCEKWHP